MDERNDLFNFLLDLNFPWGADGLIHEGVGFGEVEGHGFLVELEVLVETVRHDAHVDHGA